MKKQSGITLIALIITIIVLLILAGVSINLILGQDGVIGKSQEASIKHKYASYLEELEMSLAFENREKVNALDEYVKTYIPNLKAEDIGKIAIIGGRLYVLDKNSVDSNVVEELGIIVESNIDNGEELALENFLKHTTDKIGVELKTRTADATDWKIVSEINKATGNVDKVYGTGFYYIESEKTEIPGIGKLKNSYLVNYNDITIVNTNAMTNYSYTYLDINSTLGVTDNLILNIDARNIMDIDQWGNGISLYKYDETIYPSQTVFEDAPVGYDREEITDISNYVANNAFLFNGNNYIEIYNENTFDFSEGLTFEFFGKIKGNAGPQVQASSGWYTGMFGMWDGKTESAEVRFGITGMNLWFNFAAAQPNNLSQGSHSKEGAPWNQAVDISGKWNNKEEDLYFSITLNKPQTEDGNAEFYIYVNGEKYVDNGWINNAYWTGFLNTVKNSNLNYFDIGRCPMTKERHWSYLVGQTYSMRMYNRSLTDAEVMDNYNKTVSYSFGK